MTAEKILFDFLSKRLKIPVNFTHQEGEKGKFLILERVGGKAADGIERASFAIQSYGDTILDACELNADVRRVMNDLLLEDRVTSVSLDSDYNWTDEETKQYRYQAIYDLVFFMEGE